VKWRPVPGIAGIAHVDPQPMVEANDRLFQLDVEGRRLPPNLDLRGDIPHHVGRQNLGGDGGIGIASGFRPQWRAKHHLVAAEDSQIEDEDRDRHDQDRLPQSSTELPGRGQCQSTQQGEPKDQGGPLGQDCQAETHAQDQCRQQPGMVAKPEGKNHAAGQPEADHPIVLGAGSLHDPHREGGGKRRCHHLTRDSSTELRGNRGHGHEAPSHGHPLHQIRQVVTAGQDLEMQNLILSPGRLIQLPEDVGGVVGNAVLDHPVGDASHVIRHRIAVVRRGD